jgi:hypothetical protein
MLVSIFSIFLIALRHIVFRWILLAKSIGMALIIAGA